MAKMGKKAKTAVCYCDTIRKGEGTNCECWDTRGNPIVKAGTVRVRRKGPRFTPSPKRFRK